MTNKNEVEFKLEVLKKYSNYGLIFRDDNVIEFSIIPPKTEINELAKRYNIKVKIDNKCLFTNFCIKILS